MSLWKRTTLRGAVLIGAACLALPASAATGPQVRARTAKVLPINDTGHLHLANPNSASNTLIEVGPAGGTLPGSVRASLAIGTSTVHVGFTIQLHGGAVVGHGTARFNPGKGEYASFGGSITVDRGSGHYAHAAGSGQVYGSINRNTDNATVQVIGHLRV